MKRLTTKIVQKVSQIKYVGGLINTALLTTPSFAIAYGWSTGDWKTVGRAHLTGMVMVASYWAGGASASAYSSAISAPTATASTYLSAAGVYVAESAAIGYSSSYAIARINGMSAAEARAAGLDSARLSATISTLDAASLAMRMYELKRSPSVSGESNGIRGIPGKLSGCRPPNCEPKAWYNFGGSQTEKGQMLGRPFDAGSFADKLGEAFSGAHDFFNDLSGWYNADGYTIKFPSDGQQFLMEAVSVVNVVPALPFATATLIQEFGVGSVLHSNSLISNQFAQ